MKKTKTRLIFLSAGIMLAAYFFHSYRIVAIAKYPTRQSLAEKRFLVSSKSGDQVRITDELAQSQKDADSQPDKNETIEFSGSIISFENGIITLKTKEGEKKIAFNEKMAREPVDLELAQGIEVTVSAFNDGESLVASELSLSQEDLKDDESAGDDGEAMGIFDSSDEGEEGE